MRTRKPNLTLTLVVWEDAVKNDDRPAHTEHACVVGRLVRISEADVVLALEPFADGDNRSFLTIPRGMVRRMKLLKLYVPEFTVSAERRQQRIRAEAELAGTSKA
jgi:hypothetical protein